MVGQTWWGLLYLVHKRIEKIAKKAAREIVEEYARNITGKTANRPRWKQCVGSASDSFTAAVGKMYVTKHFKEDAKTAMIEMVQYIKEEFRNILDEVHDKLRMMKENTLKNLINILIWTYHPTPLRLTGWMARLGRGHTRS